MMENNEIKIVEALRPYYSIAAGKRVLEELKYNSYRMIKSVYRFQHFDEFMKQKRSDKNDDKKEVYWNAAYFELLIDYIKISVAFENHNKVVLLENGYVVHEMKKDGCNNELTSLQKKGFPIKIEDFKELARLEPISRRGVYRFSGLTPQLNTISYATTLSENYQEIIGLDNELKFWLKEINSKRNQLHFFTEFKGSHEVNSHIAKWQKIMDLSFSTIQY